MPRRLESPPALLHELLDWIAARPRTYDDAIQAWRSNCPRHPVLDDAFTEGLISVAGKSVVLTESGRKERREPVIVREQQPDDYEAIRHVYAEAFRKPGFRPPLDPGCVPAEVPLFEALWDAGDVVHELSFTADADGAVIGHVTASKATVATDPVVAVGPIGVLPDHQGAGIGSALMDALLTATDTAGVPLVVLLGSPQYYGRFGFRPARELGVITPESEWGDAFQARALSAHTSLLAGPFRYAPAFSL